MNHFTAVLKKYTQFSGRSGKAEFWYFILINFIISIVVAFMGNAINFPILTSIYSLIVLLPTLAVGSRRMHDIGKSGWFFLIPFYNIYLAIQDSEIGENNYGQAQLSSNIS